MRCTDPTCFSETHDRADHLDAAAMRALSARRYRATLVTAIRFAHVTATVAKSASRRAEAAAVLETRIAEYVADYGPIEGPVESLWAAR